MLVLVAVGKEKWPRHERSTRQFLIRLTLHSLSNTNKTAMPAATFCHNTIGRQLTASEHTLTQLSEGSSYTLVLGYRMPEWNQDSWLLVLVAPYCDKYIIH